MKGMIRTVFTFFIVTVFTSPVAGQEVNPDLRPGSAYRSPLLSNFELFIGPSMVYFADSYRDNDVLKIGFTAHVGLVNEFNERFQLSSLFGYENKGVKSIYYSMNEDYTPPAEMKHELDLTLNYFTFSLLGKYSVLNNKLFFGAGPYVGYLLKAKNISKLYLNGTLHVRSGYRLDPGTDYKQYDLGLVIFVGYNVYQNENLTGNVQVMFKHGLIEINQPMITPIKTNSLSFLVSIHKKSTSP